MVIFKWDSKSRFVKNFRTCCRYAWIVIFGTVTLLLLVLTIRKVDPDNRKADPELRMIAPQIAQMTQGCKAYQCSVICVNATDLNLEMQEAILDTGCKNIDTLHIDRHTFTNGNLVKHWTQISTSFYEVLITNSNLDYIMPEAFDSDEFTQTFSLSLEGIPLTALEGSALLGLPKLETLSISAPIDHISRVFFQPIRASLKTLKLTRMTDAIQFNDLFGVSNMSRLEDLDLSNNHFYKPLTLIGFLHLSNVRYLDLSRSEISVIGRNAFEPIKNTLKFLDLSHNNLTTLGPGTLDGILESRKTYIYLRENYWICDCNLAPLVKYYNQYSEVFLDLPICHAPQIFYGEDIISVEMCEVSTYFTEDSSFNQEVEVTSLETTDKERSSMGFEKVESTLVEIQSTSSPGSKVTCAERQKNSSTSLAGAIQYMHLDPPSHEFSLTYLGDKSVEVDVAAIKDQVTILWFNDPDIYGVFTSTNDDFGCIGQSNGSIVIRNLHPNVSYTFCLIPKGKVAISPFNCLPFYIPLEPIDTCDGWLNTTNKQVVVILACIVLVISFGIGAAISYIAIRNFPQILKGNKRVLVVKKEKPDTSPTVSSVSESIDKRNLKRMAPPPPYKKFSEEDSSYEIPIEVAENEYLDQFQRCYSEPLPEGTPEVPPPLPKRNSEQIYCSAANRDKLTKRSI